MLRIWIVLMLLTAGADPKLIEPMASNSIDSGESP